LDLTVAGFLSNWRLQLNVQLNKIKPAVFFAHNNKNWFITMSSPRQSGSLVVRYRGCCACVCCRQGAAKLALLIARWPKVRLARLFRLRRDGVCNETTVPIKRCLCAAQRPFSVPETLHKSNMRGDDRGQKDDTPHRRRMPMAAGRSLG
jgi:hypothetical protein